MGIVLVTGGAGFIGHHLVNALIERGDRVLVVDNYAGGYFPDRTNHQASYYDVDIADPAKAGLLKDLCVGVTHIFHLAALPRVQYSIEFPIETTRVNVQGTVAVLEAARIQGVRRVVFASSSSVYGDSELLPLCEDMQTNPMSPYAWHKLTSEGACKVFHTVHGLESVCLRFFNVYGPRSDPHGAYALVVAKFLEQRRQGMAMTITGDGTQTRDFTYVDDIVRGMLLAAENPQVGSAEVINLGGGKQISVNEVAKCIGGPTEHIAARLEPHDTLASIEKAKALLGWQPRVSFAQGIEELKRLNS